MSRRIVGGGAKGEHLLGPGVLTEVAVHGAALQGEVRVLRGSAVVGTLALGSGVGTRINLQETDFPVAFPCVIQTHHAADNVAAEFNGYPKG